MGKLAIKEEQGLFAITWNPPGGEDQVTYRGNSDWTILATLMGAVERPIGAPVIKTETGKVEPEKASENGDTPPPVGPPNLVTAEQAARGRLDLVTQWVREWDGLEVAGQPAPCTDALKRAHLMQCPSAMWQIYGVLSHKVAEVLTQGKGSGSGSSSGSPSLTSIAGTESPETGDGTGAATLPG